MRIFKDKEKKEEPKMREPYPEPYEEEMDDEEMEEEVEEEKPKPKLLKKVVAKEDKVMVAERVINLQLINDKLNFIIENLSKVQKKLDEFG